MPIERIGRLCMATRLPRHPGARVQTVPRNDMIYLLSQIISHFMISAVSRLCLQTTMYGVCNSISPQLNNKSPN